MTESITELRIEDNVFKAKGTFLFGKTAERYAKKEVDEDTGKETKGDGVTSIFMGLMQQDPDALVKFWHCATAHYKKGNQGFDAPTLEDVSEAIEDIADESDLHPYFVGALRMLNEGGYYKGKLQTLWFMMNRSYSKLKGEEKEKQKETIETFQSLYKEATGNPPFEVKA